MQLEADILVHVKCILYTPIAARPARSIYLAHYHYLQYKTNRSRQKLRSCRTTAQYLLLKRSSTMPADTCWACKNQRLTTRTAPVRAPQHTLPLRVAADYCWKLAPEINVRHTAILMSTSRCGIGHRFQNSCGPSLEHRRTKLVDFDIYCCLNTAVVLVPIHRGGQVCAVPANCMVNGRYPFLQWSAALVRC
jgi:hypothetical protein